MLVYCFLHIILITSFTAYRLMMTPHSSISWRHSVRFAFVATPSTIDEQDDKCFNSMFLLVSLNYRNSKIHKTTWAFFSEIWCLVRNVNRPGHAIAQSVWEHGLCIWKEVNFVWSLRMCIDKAWDMPACVGFFSHVHSYIALPLNRAIMEFIWRVADKEKW